MGAYRVNEADFKKDEVVEEVVTAKVTVEIEITADNKDLMTEHIDEFSAVCNDLGNVTKFTSK